MNSLHGIQLANDAVAVRGKTLKYHRASKQLSLDGTKLTAVFMSRKRATTWATEHGARVAAT